MAGPIRTTGVIVALLCLLACGPAAARAAPARGDRVAKPAIEFDPIPYDSARKRQMAAYSNRHYGEREWRLEDPKAIVLHYTAGSTYSSAWSTFASNAPSLGERPGVCAQFVVDKDGTIYQLTRLAVRCRHTIGLNHVAFGIEMVQEDLGGSHRTSQAILDRQGAGALGGPARGLAARPLPDRLPRPDRARDGQRLAPVRGPQGVAQRPHRLAQGRDAAPSASA